MDEVIPIPVILAFAAILILLGSFAWVTYRDSRGSGIDQHDSLTPQHTTRLWEAVEANQ